MPGPAHVAIRLSLTLNICLTRALSFASGCILAELTTGRPLFPGKNHCDQLWLVMKGVGRLTEHQMRLLRKDPQLASFRQPMPHEYVPLEARCVAALATGLGG